MNILLYIDMDLNTFPDFPGEVINNIYTFPSLYTIRASGTKSIWTAYISLRRSGKKIVIHDKYLTLGERIPNGVIAETYQQYGEIDGAMQCTPPFQHAMPKNIGKSDERNVLQCAMIFLRHLWIPHMS